MRSLFRSNKSQSSIDRFTSSREGSPTHSSHSEAPAYPAPTSPLTPRYPGGAHDGALDSPEIHSGRYTRDFEQSQSHPAHRLTRSQSHRVGSNGDANVSGRPTLHIIGPSSPETETIHEDQRTYPPPPFNQVHAPAPEKEHKKSKRSIFSLHSTPKEAKENSPTSPSQYKGPIRTGSLLRRAPPGHQTQVSISGPQYPQVQPGNSARFGRSQEGFQSSTEQLNPSESDDRAFQNESYYRGQTRYDQPGSQSPAQLQSESQRFSQQPAHYPPPPQSQPRSETPDTYNSYQRQQELQADSQENLIAHDSRQIRPSSQLSFGPPSPGEQSVDSRPSSATNQSRFSGHSIGQPQQQSVQQPQHLAMARGDPANGLRDQITQQRDPRAQESDHRQYGGQQDPRTRVSQHPPEQGRSTPPPRNREDIGSLDFQTLLQRHEELQAKYSKVKRYYFEKDTQVTQLQNLIANQRLSMSKTMFDDHQYTSRFDRLNGAIRDLAFSIRKDWKGIPPWLTHVVNRDAHTVGTKEMTAVGRACITCWLMDEIFNRFFHPDLEPGLSSQLKLIEKTLRRSGSSSITTDEQREDLTTKLITWRLATIEGLAEHLNNAQAGEYRAKLVHLLSERLTAALKVNLPEITPTGLETGVSMIIELAVSIAQCLPLESRDICIEYFMPGAPINDNYMKIEAPPAPLINPGAALAQPDMSDLTEGADDVGSSPENGARDAAAIENEIREASAKAAGQAGRTEPMTGSTTLSKDLKGKKGSLFGGLGMSKKAPPPGMGSAGAGISRESNAAEVESNEGKIRMAVFFAVEVRGKAGTGKEGGGSGGDKPVVLIKAPAFGY